MPDPAMALNKILSRLVDDHGHITIPGFYDKVREASTAEKENFNKLPFDEKLFRQQAGMADSMQLTGDSQYNIWERVWTRPSLTVHALEASSMKGAISQILDSAKARFSVRIVPNLDPQEVLQQLKDAVTKDPPWGVEVEVLSAEVANWWLTEPEGQAFDMAKRALAKGYDHEVALIGCGGSIPFVGPFAKVLGGVPALLIGVEDPYCNAHAENESLHLGDFDKGIRSAIYLYNELSYL